MKILYDNTVNLTITFFNIPELFDLMIEGVHSGVNFKRCLSRFSRILYFHPPKDMYIHEMQLHASAKLEYIDEPLFEPKISKNPKVS